MAWTVETAGKVVDEELDALDLALRARLARFARLIEAHGPEALKMPHARHLGGKLWELRLQGQNTVARVIYLTMTGQRVVLLRAFVKKTQKTPAHEIAVAMDRARKIEK